MGFAVQKRPLLAAVAGSALTLISLLPLLARAGSIFDDDYKPPPVHAPEPDSSRSTPSPPSSQTPAPEPEPTPPPAPRIKPTAQGVQKGRYPLPVPAKAACTDADKLVHEVFHDEFAKNTPADKMALGVKLLSEASAEGNDPVTRYVLLKDAIDATEAATDAVHALQAIDMLGRLFAIDVQSMKLEAFTLAAKASINPWTAHLMTQPALVLSEETLLAGRYELCGKAAQVAESLSRKTHDPGTMGWASAWAKEADAIQLEAQRIAPLLAKVKEAKADESANTDVGRFFCLYCGQWEVGLPLLAKGSDASLKTIAQKELASSDLLSGAQVSLGDLWLDAANKQTSLAKDSAQRRACYWYHLAEPNATGLAKLTLSKKIRDAALPHMLHGVLAEYFRGRYFSSKMRTRVDSSIDWDWSAYPPEPEINRDRFSARWTGWLKAPAAGSYKILVRHDDGVRVYIDGRLVIDQWDRDTVGLGQAMVPLGTEPVQLSVEYYQVSGAAYMGLGWVIPNSTKPRAIPLTAFLHEPIDMREILPKVATPDREGAVTLRASDATLHGSRVNVWDTDSQIDHTSWWTNPSEWISWDLKASAGDYDVTVNAGVDGGSAGGTYVINIGGVELNGTTVDTGGWGNFADMPVGRIHVAAGKQTLWIRAINMVHEGLMDLHTVILTPAKAE